MKKWKENQEKKMTSAKGVAILLYIAQRAFANRIPRKRAATFWKTVVLTFKNKKVAFLFLSTEYHIYGKIYKDSGTSEKKRED